MKFFTARLFGLCLLFSGSVASADFGTTDSSNLNQVRIDTSAIRTTLDYLNGSVGSDLGLHVQRIEGRLDSINYALQSGGVTWSQLEELKARLGAIKDNTRYLPDDVFALLQAVNAIRASITNSSPPSVYVTNNVTLHPDDVLAGNPWWSTNSAFALSKYYYPAAFPNESPNTAQTFSFPQAFSQVASKLAQPYSSFSTNSYRNWYDFWGRDGYTKWGTSDARFFAQNYTWFDWITDAFRSNWVSSASYNRDLISALQSMTNSFNPAGTISIDFSALVTNQIALYNWMTNVITPSALSSVVPWWYTNSSFATDWSMYPYVYPADDQYFMRSFPQEFSGLMSALVRQRITSADGADDWASWGLYKENYRNGDGNTWFDWISEALVSNIVLSTSPSYSNLVAEAVTYDTSDDSNPTNVPLPGYSLPDSEIVAGASDTLNSVESGLQDKFDSLQANYTGGDDEIVVIPAFSVGGINVREYRARLGTTITPLCRRVASFIWYVGLFAFLFSFAKSEFVYYATLGKFWVKHV